MTPPDGELGMEVLPVNQVSKKFPLENCRRINCIFKDVYFTKYLW